MKSILSLTVFLFLVCASIPTFADTGAYQQDLTGQDWCTSSSQEKLAFLYGVSSVVAIEQLIAQKEGKNPSVFVRSWTSAFGRMTLPDLQKKLDTWYAAHPEAAKKQVFEVLWDEFMRPQNVK